MPLISVIVPVYKVEAFLPACVDSILAQSFSDFELILVDDGSPDRCGEICDEYAKRDPRIRVIHQENRGLSGARNSALDIASGSCVSFIDSDDAVTPDFLSALYKAMTETDSAIASCRFCHIDFSNSPAPGTSAEVSVISGPEAARSMYSCGELLPVCAISKLYRAELWKTVRFPLGKIHEDQAVIPMLAYQSERCVAVDRRLYGYRVNTGGITHSTFSNRRFEDIEAIDGCIRFFEERGEQEIIEAAKKRRQERIGAYVLDAYRAQKEAELPAQYQMSKFAALKLLRQSVPNYAYMQYLKADNHL